MTLSPAATIVLTRAAAHPDRLLEFHRKLPTAARHKMIDTLLRDGLIAESAGDYRLGDGSTLIEDVETGMLRTTLAITDEGFRALGLEPPTMSEADIEQEFDLQQDAIDAENARTDADMAPQAAADDVVAQEAATVADALDAAPVPPTAALLARTTLRQAAVAVLAAWDEEVIALRTSSAPWMARWRHCVACWPTARHASPGGACPASPARAPSRRRC